MAELSEKEEVTHVGETQESSSSVVRNEDRDFMIRTNGQKVKVQELEGKYVGLYFAAEWCYSCRYFTIVLSKIYKKLSENGDFEIVFVSADKNEKLFEAYHQTMPWLAVPFSDDITRRQLNRAFQVDHIPTLIVLDKEARVITTEGVEIIEEYGVEGYPFTAERLVELKAEEEAIRAAQTVEALLLSDERDFVIGHGGRKVPVAELVGKTVGLYFTAHWHDDSRVFTEELAEIYNELLKKGEAFEIVFVTSEEQVIFSESDEEDEELEEFYASMPWLALPFADKTEKKLARYFRIDNIPTLIILGPDGKTVQTNALELIRDYGIRAYPFTKERLDELKAEDKAKLEAQTLESLLVSDERNFVIKQGGEQVLVSDLVGKTVALYFNRSADWWRGLTPGMKRVYNKLKQRGEAFEIVFISTDKDQTDFEINYKSMPWLTLPVGDKTRKDLLRLFCHRGTPSLIVVGPDGKTVTNDGIAALSLYGARAYPFTDAHLQRLEKERKELVQKPPKETRYSRHKNREKAQPADELQASKLASRLTASQQAQDAAVDEICKTAGVICDGDAAVDENCKSAGVICDGDAALDENCKPAGVICDGDVC